MTDFLFFCSFRSPASGSDTPHATPSSLTHAHPKPPLSISPNPNPERLNLLKQAYRQTAILHSRFPPAPFPEDWNNALFSSLIPIPGFDPPPQSASPTLHIGFPLHMTTTCFIPYKYFPNRSLTITQSDKQIFHIILYYIIGILLRQIKSKIK